MRFFRSNVPVQKSGVVNPTRLSLIASLVLVTLVLLMTWVRYRENEAARDIEAHQTTNAVTHALLHQALSIPANPAFSPNRQDETEGAAEVRREGGKHMLIVQLDTLHATLAQTDNSGLYSQKDAPRLAKSIAQFLPPLRNHIDSALRGTLGGNDNARNTWLIHRGAAASGFAHINQKPFAVVAAPAQRINENGRHEAMAIVILADANEVLAPIVTRLARSSFIEFHTSPASVSQRETMLYQNAGAAVTISWQPSAPGDSRTAGQAAALSALAAFMIGLTSWYMTKRLTESEAQASRLAAEDILTGLPNRMLFVHFLADELQRYHRTGRGLALLYLDFDRFKEINDTFGHDGGDQLIIEASRRIASVLRSGDKLCRFGGDEFGI
ncbi:MAG: GGDEF domain-containing protein, partial [Alphaproteobacteria bacterium]|nr:GGDEF domain-containing protein [Alphaproteobacteria bacterium]